MPGAELLVQRGGVAIDGTEHGPGAYLRLPAAAGAGAGDAAGGTDDVPGGTGGAAPRLLPGSLAYLSVGQLAPTDTERRVIDAGDAERWLDGPVAGVRVLPLHGHRTGNVMLVRWLGPAAFRTRLDPTGEELLVLEGTLHDARGEYPAGTWIRNPVPAWQSWAGRRRHARLLQERPLRRARVSPADAAELAARIKADGAALGLSAVRIADTDLSAHETRLLNWLDAGFHGEMEWMARHGTRRSRPAELVPGTVRIVSVRLDYFPPEAADASEVLADGTLGYVSRYALGRDYHKVLRNRLQKLATLTEARIGPFGYRAFVDSAPVLERAIAEKAGLGWIGKHANLIDARAGSWFFLGELYTDLPLPVDPPLAQEHCGSCDACLRACPTKAIVAPYRVDARRCISYHTIELAGPIPVEFRRAMGNRIYGCDDCQLACPFDKFRADTDVDDFRPRHGLDAPSLVELFGWDEARFERAMLGSPIRRLGHERWLRNIAVALGNAPASMTVRAALEARADHPSALVREHVSWALAEQAGRAHAPGE